MKISGLVRVVGMVLGLSACTVVGIGQDAGPSADAAAGAAGGEDYQPQPDLSSQQRFRQALYLLEEGRPQPARQELVIYLEAQPRSELAADLLRQIDLPALDYFPEDYREVQLAPGQSLSTLSRQYLGSVYQFHALAKYNGIAEPRKLRAGQAVRIPLTPNALDAFAALDTTGSSIASSATPEIADEVFDVLPEEAAPEILGEPATSPAAITDAETPPAATAQAVSTPAADPGQLHRQALNAYRSQDLDKAIALWDQVLEVDPDHSSARLYRSQAIELKEKLSRLN